MKQPKKREWQKQMYYLAAIISEALHSAAPSTGDMTCLRGGGGGGGSGAGSQQVVSAYWQSKQLLPLVFALQWTRAYTFISHDGENRQTS